MSPNRTAIFNQAIHQFANYHFESYPMILYGTKSICRDSGEFSLTKWYLHCVSSSNAIEIVLSTNSKTIIGIIKALIVMHTVYYTSQLETIITKPFSHSTETKISDNMDKPKETSTLLDLRDREVINDLKVAEFSIRIANK